MKFDFVQIPETLQGPGDLLKRLNGIFRRIAMVLSGFSRDGDIVQLASPLELVSYTTTERDALVSVRDGLLIFNTTIPAVQARVGGAWVSL